MSATKGAQHWKPQTRAVRSGIARTGFHETSEALFLTSGYVYGSSREAADAFEEKIERMVYTRFGNPTTNQLEARLAAIEGAEACRVTASGMAAVHAAIMSQLKTGDRVVASRALFISNNWIVSNLGRFGVEHQFVDGTDLSNWERALSRPTTVVFLETPSNPTLQIIDLKAVIDLAHAAGAKVVVDNVFATPVFQHPLELGADVIVYSATKHIDGQGRCLGGAVLSNDPGLIRDVIAPFIRHTGGALSPFNAWVLLKGLETLRLRVREQAHSAQAIAEFLETRPEVQRVLYPGLPSHPQHELATRQMDGGFGTVVAFEIAGGQEAAFAFQDSLQLIDISNNLGDAKSLITHPWTTTQQKLSEPDRLAMGVTPGLVRLSVGLEDAEDLIDDIASALDTSRR